MQAMGYLSSAMPDGATRACSRYRTLPTLAHHVLLVGMFWGYEDSRLPLFIARRFSLTVIVSKNAGARPLLHDDAIRKIKGGRRFGHI